MYLITPSLLNSLAYYLGYEAEPSDDDDGQIITAESKEAAVRAEFLQTLRREKSEPTPAMQAGIDFENRVQAYCSGVPDESELIREVGALCMGGTWQQPVKREFNGFLLYARADVIRRDTIIDLKRSKSYDVGKYQQSAQHRIELLCTELPRFSYIVSDERSWWAEDYFNHAGIEQEVASMIRGFTGYLENDPEAKDLFVSRWNALEARAA